MELTITFLLITNLALILGFLALFYSYLRLLKKYESEEHQLNKHYLKKAKTQASAIVDEAGQEALSLLSSSRIVSEKDQALLSQIVKQITEEQSIYLRESVNKLIEETTNQLSQIKSTDIQAFNTASDSLKTATSSQLEEYKTLLTQIKANTESFKQEFNSELTQIKDNNLAAINEVTKDFKTAATSQLNEYNAAILKIKTDVDKIFQDFQTQLLEIKNYDINTLTNVSKDIVKDTSAKIGEYTKVLEDETINSQKAVAKKIDDEYKKVEGEIQAYKNEQFKKIEESLNSILIKSTYEIFEKSINPAEHKNLILRTLEKAKSDNVFSTN